MRTRRNIELRGVIPSGSKLSTSARCRFAVTPTRKGSMALSNGCGLCLMSTVSSSNATNTTSGNGIATSRGDLAMAVGKGRALCVTKLPTNGCAMARGLNTSCVISTVNTAAAGSGDAAITIRGGGFAAASFAGVTENANSLAISGSIVRPCNTTCAIPSSLAFRVAISLSLGNTPVSNSFSTVRAGSDSIAGVATSDGKGFGIGLCDNSRVRVVNLPRNAITVIIRATGRNFTPAC